jgi:hypothetical protein
MRDVTDIESHFLDGRCSEHVTSLIRILIMIDVMYILIIIAVNTRILMDVYRGKFIAEFGLGPCWGDT